ncbi:MAG: hypothetical protein AAF922_11400 [Pseudomonadota bacterium]
MSSESPEAIVGRHNELDYKLHPLAHEKLYSSSAPELSQILSREGIRIEAQTYTRFDAEAESARSRYRMWMGLTNLGAFCTSVFSAGAMAWSLIGRDAAALQSGALAHGAIALSAGAALSAAAASAGLVYLRQGRMLERWMNKRALAETHRARYFEGVLSIAEKEKPEAAGLALEYFRRYQFEVQSNYYYARARKHEKSANQTVALGALGGFVASLSSLFVVFGAAEPGVGAVSVFGAAIGALAIGREQMNQDRRNAERYDRTYSALTALAKRLDAIRAAVAKGKIELIGEFGTAVNDQISNEHRQWLDDGEAVDPALSRIQEALQSTTK